MRIDASFTPAKKFIGFLSYRVAIPRNCLSLLNYGDSALNLTDHNKQRQMPQFSFNFRLLCGGILFLHAAYPGLCVWLRRGYGDSALN